MYTYIYTYMYTYMYTYIYTYTYIYMCIYMYIHICIYILIHIYTLAAEQAAYVHTNTHMCHLGYIYVPYMSLYVPYMSLYVPYCRYIQGHLGGGAGVLVLLS